VGNLDINKIFFDTFISTIQNIPLWVWMSLVSMLIFSIYRLWKISISGIAEIDRMTGPEFEYYLVTLFRNKGYTVTKTGTSYYDHRGDFGGDLIIEKDGIITAVQAKRYRYATGIDSVRQVLGAMDHYHCQNALVVSTSTFTPDAITQARESNIELWNREKLIAEINNTKLN
jgi:restriction system protein